MTTGDLTAIQAALADQFRFERLLGQGGMGEVFLARDVMLERPVAIKVLPADQSADAEQRERFLREARTAANLSHPNVVPIYFADEVAGQAFFVMSYIEGESLADRLRARGPLPVPEVVRYLREVAWALAYAHARGVVHRDVKPENIMLDRGTGRAIVTDFGIAHSRANTRLTLDGHVVGTVHYMSPEQVTGGTLDGRSDLYALGVVGYHALSGRLPFDGTAISSILVAHVNTPAPPLRSVAPHVPPAIAAVIDRCLAKAPDARFDSGEALAESLGAALTAAEVEAARDASAPPRAVSEGEASVIWRRAAQLQAEAAQRLEERARQQAMTAMGGATPASGYRLRDVEAAAVEAGISQHFVALAVAELNAAGPTAPTREIAAWQERAARRWLGGADQSLSVARVIRATPRRVLTAVGRALQAPPFSLTLRHDEASHPLDGGVLAFDIPSVTGDGSSYAWAYTRYGSYARQVRLSLRPVPGTPDAIEVTLHIDLRRGLRQSVGWGVGVTGTMGVLGGTGAAVVAAKALAVAGALVALPALGGVTLAVGLGVSGWAGMHRYSLRKTREELERALSAVENDIRSERLFGATEVPGRGAADGLW